MLAVVSLPVHLRIVASPSANYRVFSALSHLARTGSTFLIIRKLSVGNDIYAIGYM